MNGILERCVFYSEQNLIIPMQKLQVSKHNSQRSPKKSSGSHSLKLYLI